MSRKDGRIEAGQSLRTAVSAKAWNRAQDAADIVLGQRAGFAAGGVQGPDVPYTSVLCRNESGADVAAWGVLAINGIAITPSGPSDQSTKQFQEQPVIVGVTPTNATQALCVAVGPIKNQSLGRVAVHGVVQVKMEIQNASHTFARCKPSTQELISEWGGPAQVLWKEATPGGGRWALVRIGTGMPTGVDVVTNVTLEATGVRFDKQRVWAIAATGVTGVALATTGC